MKKYDYILVGSGLYSGVFAWYAKQHGKSCLVVEKRDHIGGNVYCEETEGIHVHKYGAHIFHTSNKADRNTAGANCNAKKFREEKKKGNMSKSKEEVEECYGSKKDWC